MQFKWNYTPPADTQVNAAKDLGEKLGISPILASLLIRRGITTESAAKRFFRPQLADLINPFLWMLLLIDSMMLWVIRSAFLSTEIMT